MTEQPRLTDNELEFFCVGFYRMLRQHRTKTIIGWCIAAVGIASIPLGWRFGTPHGIIDIALAMATVVAGLAVVQQSVSALDAYVRIPFPVALDDQAGTGLAQPLKELLEVMHDVEKGGWQEAYKAIAAIREIASRWGLPPLP